MLCILSEFVVPHQPKVFHKSDRKKNGKYDVALTKQISSLSSSLDPSPSVLPGMEVPTEDVLLFFVAQIPTTKPFSPKQVGVG
jgi:hypothetical protein